VFRHVCFRSPNGSELQSVTQAFVNNGYSMRRVFVEAAASCAAP
jgi:hypothetical protein